MMRTKILLIGGALAGVVVLLIITVAVMSGDSNKSAISDTSTQASTQENSDDEADSSSGSSSGSDSCPPVASNVVVFCNGEFSTVTVSAGEEVIFLNNSNQTVEPSSDPHPSHTKYPVLNIGVLEPGEQKSVVVDKVGKWGIHDHRNQAHKGQVIVE